MRGWWQRSMFHGAWGRDRSGPILIIVGIGMTVLGALIHWLT